MRLSLLRNMFFNGKEGVGWKGSEMRAGKQERDKQSENMLLVWGVHLLPHWISTHWIWKLQAKPALSGFFFPILPSLSSPIPRYFWKMRNYTKIFPPANPSGLCFLASFYNDYPHCRYSFPFNSWKGEKWLNVCKALSFAFRSGKCNEFHFRSLFSYSLGRIVWAAAVRLYQAWTVSDRYECIYLRFWHLKSSQQNSS